jgi:hypothetical protein
MSIYLNALQEQATGTPAGVMETPTATPHTKLTEVYILLLYDIVKAYLLYKAIFLTLIFTPCFLNSKISKFIR